MQWIYERKLFATLIAMEKETGISFHDTTGPISVIRDLCINGEFFELGDLLNRMLPMNRSLNVLLLNQDLMEKLSKIDTKDDVLKFISSLQKNKSILPADLATKFEDALTCADPSNHQMFNDWSVARGRYELLEELLGKLKGAVPESFPAPSRSYPIENGSQNHSFITVDESPSSRAAHQNSLVPRSRYHDPSNQPIRTAVFSNSGRYVSVGTNNQSLVLCDVVDRDQLRVVGKSQKIHSGSVYACAWSPDDRWLATGSNDQTVRISPLSQLLGESVDRVGCRIQLQSGTVRSLCYLADGSVLVCGVSGDDGVRGVDTHTGQGMWSLSCSGGEGYINTVDMDGSGTGRVASASSTGTVCVIDPRTVGKVWEAHEISGSSSVACIYGDSVAVGTETGELSLYDIRSSAHNPIWHNESGHFASVRAVDFDRSGRFLSTASFDKTCKIFDSVGGHMVKSLEAHSDRAVWVNWSPTDDVIVSCGTDSSVVLFG